MPSYNFTIPDSSPIISYMGGWGDSDTGIDKYTNQTFHFTYNPGAYAEFKFNGTGVELYGAYRANHGLYTATVDGGHSMTGNGGGKGDMYNQTLYAVGGLPFGEHTVRLTNVGSTSPPNTYVDLDWAVVQIGDGKAATPNDDIWLDDAAAGNWTWGAGWTAGTNDLSPEYLDKTFHSANDNGAKATLSFYGNGVQLYGATSMNHGPYSVSLDGGAPVAYNGSQVAFRPQQLLYLASGLPTGMHTVTLTNEGTSFTDLDYAIVSRYGISGGVSVGSSTSASGTTATAPAPASSSSAPGSGATDTSAPPFVQPTTSGTAAADTTSTASAVNPSASNAAAPRSRVGAVALGALALCSLFVSVL